MTKAIKAIPTEYKGIQMRSRLEARWAMFFDKLGWGWSYEPIEYDGWIPDFLLRAAIGHIRIDVKPELMSRVQLGSPPNPSDIAQMNAHRYWNFQSKDIRAKIDECFPLPGDGAPMHEVLGCFALVLAAEPSNSRNQIAIGYIRGLTGIWVDAKLCIWSEDNRQKMGIASSYGIYSGCVDILNGMYRPYQRSHLTDNDVLRVMELWNECKNYTQWKGKQAVC